MSTRTITQLFGKPPTTGSGWLNTRESYRAFNNARKNSEFRPAFMPPVALEGLVMRIPQPDSIEVDKAFGLKISGEDCGDLGVPMISLLKAVPGFPATDVLIRENMTRLGIPFKTAVFNSGDLKAICFAGASLMRSLAILDGMDPDNYRREFIGLVRYPEAVFRFALQRCRQGCLHLKNYGVSDGQLGHAGLLIPAR